MHTPEDAALLRLLQSDAEAGVDALLQQYGRLIDGIVSRALPGHPQDAEECSADVLVAVWKHAQELLQTGRPLRPWLIVTARNAAIDRQRQLTRRGELSLKEELTQAEAQSISSELEETIQQLVGELEEPDRTIFLRKYWLLQSAKEIGAALGMTEITVNTRLHRGRQRLRRRLDELKRKTEGLNYGQPTGTGLGHTIL